MGTDEQLKQIEAANGDGEVSAYYDGGKELPWRIAGYGTQASFATAEEAENESEAWGEE